MSTTQLQTGLADLRRKLIRTGTQTGAAWGVFAAVVVLLAAMWLDLVVDLPADLRVACGAAAIVGAVVLAVRLVLRAIQTSGAAAIAHRLDSAASARGEIVSGIDLALHPTAGGAMTAGLAHIAIERAADLVRQVPASAVVPMRELRKPLTWLAITAGCIVVVAIVAPRLAATQFARFADPYGDHPPYSSVAFNVDPGNTRVVYGGTIDVVVKTAGGSPDRVDLILLSDGMAQEPLPMFPETSGQWRASLANITMPGRYFVRAGRARSHQFDLGVITVPKLESVAFKVTWPAYTNRPPYEGPLPQGGLSGLPGTVVQVKARSNRQLASGTMAFTPTTQPAAMKPSSSQEVVGSFAITQPGKVTIGVTDTDGQTSTETFTAPIGVLKDERPFVRLTDPKPNSFATPSATIQVVAIAEDDFGVSKVSIYRALNDTRPRPMDVAVPEKRPTMFPATLNLPLSDYGLRPGDVVKLFARVEDNDPAGAKGAESSVVTIHVISQEEMDQMIVAREGLEAMEAKYAEAARRLEAMATKAQKLQEELAKLDPNSELAAEKRKELEQLAKEMEHAASEIEKTATNDLPIDLDKALSKELTKAAQALLDAATDARAAAEGMKAGAASEKMADAAKKLGKGREELKENAQEPLEHLAKVMPLMEAEQRFIDLAAQQRELAERTAAVETEHGKDNPQLKARMRDLQEQQEQTRRELGKLLDDIDDAVAQLPEDKQFDDLRKTAKKFSDAVRKSPADSQMQQAETALNDFAGTRASLAAKEAAATLESFIGECNGMGKEGGVCMKFQPTLSKSLGNSVKQLLGMGEGLMGQGAGQGGYSARRSSLQNVGLYGSRPTRSAASKSGDGRSDKGAASRADGQPDGNTNPDGTGAAGNTQAQGENDAAVPPQYKKRVGDYFRRVADELEE